MEASGIQILLVLKSIFPIIDRFFLILQEALEHLLTLIEKN